VNFHFVFLLKVHFWGGIQEQYDLGNKFPFVIKQSIFLMLIMWHAASHHKSQFAIYSFAVTCKGCECPRRTSR